MLNQLMGFVNIILGMKIYPYRHARSIKDGSGELLKQNIQEWLFLIQEYTAISRELGQVKDQLVQRDEEISELKSERNNTRVSSGIY